MDAFHFVQFVATRNDIPVTEARKIVNIIFDSIRAVLLSGDSVTITGMCRLQPFYRINRNGAVWKSPVTGKTAPIKDKVQLRCKALPTFIKRMTERLLYEKDQ